MRQTKQQAAQAKQRGAGEKNTFSVDGIRRYPLRPAKAAESQHKAIGQPRQRRGEPPSDCCIAEVSHDAAGKT